MGKQMKKVVIIILTFLLIFTATVSTYPQQEVAAASGYSGKIFRHWCKLRTKK